MHGVVRESTDSHPELTSMGVKLHHGDLTDREATHALLRQVDPNQIFHLAAQAFVPLSFEDPWGTLENNIRSQLNLLTYLADNQSDTRILIVSSAEVYGQVKTEDSPITEEQPFQPNNPYSVSKVTQDMLAKQYFLSHQVQALRVRPFNHAGPGQNVRFVVPAFASQIAKIESGLQPPTLAVGNLEAERDFTDVRDIAEAYITVMRSGQVGDVYNVGSGRCISIQYILDSLLKLSDTRITITIDPNRFRPVDVKQIVCDNSKLVSETGWMPRISIEETLRDVLQEWRTKTAT